MFKNLSLKKIGLALAALLLIAQAFRIDTTNPPIDPEADFIHYSEAPLGVKQILERSCYDCHAHTTAYPWYAQIAPVSWWLKDHVNDGRRHLNFSIWATYKAKKKIHKLEECIELTEEQEMPLDSYTWMHKDAKLSAEQRERLLNWFKSSLAKERDTIPHS